MPDLLVGTTIAAADVPPSVGDDDLTNITGFSEGSFVQGSPIVGAAFTAPTSGRVWILYGTRMEGDTSGNRVRVSIDVRTGSTVGSGTSVSPADIQVCLESMGKAGGTASRFNGATYRVVTGLTPGDTYNVALEYQGNGSIYRRHLAVIPLP